PFAVFLQEMLPFLRGFTMLFWATATWWIPMLLTLGFWRHVYKRFPLRYDPLFWGAVFPLGMYSVSTKQLSLAFQLPIPGLAPQDVRICGPCSLAVNLYGIPDGTEVAIDTEV